MYVFHVLLLLSLLANQIVPCGPSASRGTTEGSLRAAGWGKDASGDAPGDGDTLLLPQIVKILALFE